MRSMECQSTICCVNLSNESITPKYQSNMPRVLTCLMNQFAECVNLSNEPRAHKYQTEYAERVNMSIE